MLTKEIEERYEVIKIKKNNFLREEDLLPADEKKKREEEIIDKEKAAKELNFIEAAKFRDEIKSLQEKI